jgi:hypothetical protein
MKRLSFALAVRSMNDAQDTTQNTLVFTRTLQRQLHLLHIDAAAGEDQAGQQAVW